MVSSSTQARRWGSATSALVRRLVTVAQPVNQVALARELGVSQPRISQILRLLAKHGIDVDLLGDPQQRRRLVDLYVHHHRPDNVAEALFYGLDAPYEQVRQVVDDARRARVRIAVSADLAPDLVAPWRTPTLTVVYSERPLVPGSLVPAMARGEASIIVRPIADAALLEPWETRRDIPLAHPVQQVWDLYDLGGEDRIEAAERLLNAVMVD